MAPPGATFDVYTGPEPSRCPHREMDDAAASYNTSPRRFQRSCHEALTINPHSATSATSSAMASAQPSYASLLPPPPTLWVTSMEQGTSKTTMADRGEGLAVDSSASETSDEGDGGTARNSTRTRKKLFGSRSAGGLHYSSAAETWTAPTPFGAASRACRERHAARGITGAQDIEGSDPRIILEHVSTIDVELDDHRDLGRAKRPFRGPDIQIPDRSVAMYEAPAVTPSSFFLSEESSQISIFTGSPSTSYSERSAPSVSSRGTTPTSVSPKSPLYPPPSLPDFLAQSGGRVILTAAQGPSLDATFDPPLEGFPMARQPSSSSSGSTVRHGGDHGWKGKPEPQSAHRTLSRLHLETREGGLEARNPSLGQARVGSASRPLTRDGGAAWQSCPDGGPDVRPEIQAPVAVHGQLSSARRTLRRRSSEPAEVRLPPSRASSRNLAEPLASSVVIYPGGGETAAVDEAFAGRTPAPKMPEPGPKAVSSFFQGRRPFFVRSKKSFRGVKGKIADAKPSGNHAETCGDVGSIGSRRGSDSGIETGLGGIPLQKGPSGAGGLLLARTESSSSASPERPKRLSTDSDLSAESSSASGEASHLDPRAPPSDPASHGLDDDAPGPIARGDASGLAKGCDAGLGLEDSQVKDASNGPDNVHRSPSKMTAKTGRLTRKWNLFGRLQSRPNVRENEKVRATVTAVAKKPVAFYAMTDTWEQADGEPSTNTGGSLSNSGFIGQPPNSPKAFDHRRPGAGFRDRSGPTAAAHPLPQAGLLSSTSETWAGEGFVAPSQPLQLPTTGSGTVGWSGILARGRPPRLRQRRRGDVGLEGLARRRAEPLAADDKADTQTGTSARCAASTEGAAALGPSRLAMDEIARGASVPFREAGAAETGARLDEGRYPTTVPSVRRHELLKAKGSSCGRGGAFSFASAVAVIPQPDDPPVEDEIWDEYDDLFEDVGSGQQHDAALGSRFLMPMMARRSQLVSTSPFEVAGTGAAPPPPTMTTTTTMTPTTSTTTTTKKSRHTARMDSEAWGQAQEIKNAKGQSWKAERAPSRTDSSCSVARSGGGGGGSWHRHPDARGSSGGLADEGEGEGEGEVDGDAASGNDGLEQEDQDEELLSQVDLRVGSMTVSKWLTFGHVMFSDIRHDLALASEQRSILVIDGLGNDDWSFYAAETYPSASFFNLSPRAPPRAAACETGPSSYPTSPANHYQIQYSSHLDPFPFLSQTFDCVVYRFPEAAPEAAHANVVYEALRVLRPGGQMELSILDVDLNNMGARCQQRVQRVKARAEGMAKGPIEGSAANLLLRLLGQAGFRETRAARVGVPLAGSITLAHEGQEGVGGSQGGNKSEGGWPAVKMMDAGGGLVATEEGLARVVTGVGRWWYSRCYEMMTTTAHPRMEGTWAEESAAAESSMWTDRELVAECERRGTSLRLMICCAQAPPPPL